MNGWCKKPVHSFVAALAVVFLFSCTGKLDVSLPGPVTEGTIEPVSVASSLTKVKGLLTGLPPTDQEIAAVQADPNALRGMVQGWVNAPEHTPKLMSFLSNAFQQSQAVSADFSDQLGDAQGILDAKLLANLRESFARTALQLIGEGQPFTATMTTRRFMLTTRLMLLYAYLDSIQIGDSGNEVDLFAKANPGFSFTLTAKSGPIPLTDTFDRKSPNFMIFYAPQLAGAAYDAACPQDPIVYNGGTGQSAVSASLYVTLQGKPASFSVPAGNGKTHTCQPPAFPAANQPLTTADSQEWKMVEIVQADPGQGVSSVLDLTNFRTGGNLLLRTPRVGFFTTPSFLAEWNTNDSNQARVTANQTLIVALGHAMSPTNASLPPSTAAVDLDHAPLGTACYACHQSLDPMRQYFRQTYSYYFHPQIDSDEASLPGSFGFRGMSMSGSNIFDLANQLAAHPDFAGAWVQKLCTWGNSSRCDETDGEFQRIAALFSDSLYDWKTLEVTLFSSPIVTYLQPTRTVSQGGEVFPVARRDHLCGKLSGRLGITDVCGLDVNTVVPQQLKQVQFIATVLPSDSYSRGAEDSVLANDPNLFFRTGMENICAILAARLIDSGATQRWSSASPTPAIADFVHTLMGIGTGRDATPISILTDHLTSARAGGLSASDALKSTFVLACLSPSVVGMGQ
ncbi:MAG TPA: hypothetical protein VMK66_04085 [Myxococcales bacterium]|nr:hypothetical protein [Myxococcales bacterium]